METNKLIRDALGKMCEGWATAQGATETDHSRYAHIAAAQLDTFDDLYSKKDWTTSIETVFKLATEPPKELSTSDQAGYARFIYDLMKTGTFHGMAHEDPLGANVLIGSALTLFRRLIVDEQQRALLPCALDLILLQSIAYMGAGARDIARLQLLSIVDLTADTQIGSVEISMPVTQSEALHFMDDILLRAAPAAMMLSDIFKFDQDEKRSQAALMLAQRLYEEVLEKNQSFPGTLTDRLMAMTALSEIHFQHGERTDGTELLDKALWLLESDASSAYLNQSTYQYVASVVRQRRAQIEMVQEDLNAATGNYVSATELAKRALEQEPLNTHYHDHYADLLNELGILYGVRGHFIQAQDSFLRAIDSRRELLAKSNQYSEGLIIALNNMSTLMRKYNKNDLALLYLKDALDLAEQHGLDEDLATQLRGLLHEMKQKSPVWNKSLKANTYGAN